VDAGVVSSYPRRLPVSPTLLKCRKPGLLDDDPAQTEHREPVILDVERMRPALIEKEEVLRTRTEAIGPDRSGKFSPRVDAGVCLLAEVGNGVAGCLDFAIEG
jgi:hypothetical protein